MGKRRERGVFEVGLDQARVVEQLLAGMAADVPAEGRVQINVHRASHHEGEGDVAYQNLGLERKPHDMAYLVKR